MLWERSFVHLKDYILPSPNIELVHNPYIVFSKITLENIGYVFYSLIDLWSIFILLIVGSLALERSSSDIQSLSVLIEHKGFGRDKNWLVFDCRWLLQVIRVYLSKLNVFGSTIFTFELSFRVSVILLKARIFFRNVRFWFEVVFLFRGCIRLLRFFNFFFIFIDAIDFLN